MNRVFLSVIFVFVVVSGLVVFQATKQTASHVLLPSELSSQPKEKLSRVRVGGRVVEPIAYQTQPSIDLKFNITDPPHKDGRPGLAVSVPVHYNNLKPDMFTAGRDVIIEGEFTNGVLEAGKLLTQCPSKYEPPDPESIATKGNK